MLEPEIIRRDREKEQERYLHENVYTDADAVDFLRLVGRGLFVGHRYNLHFRDWNA